VVADRAAVLSEVVSAAGVTDVTEGADLLAASEDLAVQSALLGSVGEGDLAAAMDMAAISGQLQTVGLVADGLQMPILAAFLADKGDEGCDKSSGRSRQRNRGPGR
jgi:hypothetical protein